jgi:hypothetical protein
MENEIVWFGPAVKGRRGEQSGISVVLHDATKSSKHRQTVIRLYPDAMKKFRLLAGDRVLIGKDSSGLYIKRTPNGGFALSSANPEKTRGQSVTSFVKLQEIAGLRDRIYGIDEVVELHDGVIFIAI